jgi:hypothetical protein
MENSVLMRIFDGDDLYLLNDHLLRFELEKHMRKCDVGAVIGARDRLVHKKMLTKRFELTDKGRKKCDRIQKRRFGKDDPFRNPVLKEGDLG